MNEYSAESIKNKTQPHSNMKDIRLTKGINEITQKDTPEIVYFDSSEPQLQTSDSEVLLE